MRTKVETIFFKNNRELNVSNLNIELTDETCVVTMIGIDLNQWKEDTVLSEVVLETNCGIDKAVDYVVCANGSKWKRSRYTGYILEQRASNKGR